MSPYKEHTIEQKYWTPKQVADKFGIETSCLRFWESFFDELNPQRGNRFCKNGYERKYTTHDLEVVHIIYELIKKQGLTMEGARLFLKDPDEYIRQLGDLAIRKESHGI